MIDTPLTQAWEFHRYGVIKIETASGHTILASRADYIILSRYSWYVSKSGGGRLYAHARVPGAGERISMHRLLMQPPEGMVVHHKNNDGLDNRRLNLEVATQRTNCLHAHAHKKGGVHFDKQSGKWRAQLRDPNGKLVSLGMHATRKAALAAAAKFKLENRPHIRVKRPSARAA